MCKVSPQVTSPVSPTANTTLFDKFRQLGGQGAIYGIGTILQRLAAFLLLPIYTNLLTTAEYGVLEIVTITGLVAGTLFGLGLRSALFRSIVDGDDDKHWRVVFSTALYITIASALILAVLTFAGASIVGPGLFDSENGARYLLLIMSTTALEIVVQLAVSVFRARHQPIRFLILQIFGLLSRIGAIIYFVVYGDAGVDGVLLGQLIAMGATAILTLIAARKGIVPSFDSTEAARMIAFGVPILFASLFGFVSTYIDRYFLNGFTTADEVGVYSLAYRLGMIMVFVWITPLKMAWGPMFLSVKDSGDFAAFCAKSMTYVMLIGGWLFLAVSLLSRELILVMADESFHRAYRLVPIIAATYLIWSLRSVLDVGIQIERRTKWIAFYTGFGAVINVGLNLWWIPKYGANGAAWATFVSFASALAISFRVNRNLLVIPYEFWRLTMLAVVVGALFALGFYWHPDSIVYSICYKVGLLAAFPMVLWLGGFVRREESIGIGRIIGSVGVGQKRS